MLSAMQYPHWLMVADAVLVCSDLSVLYFARQERTEPDAAEFSAWTYAKEKSKELVSLRR
jgi:hypothetical protein